MSFRLFIYYCALCGGWAAFLTWGLLRVIAQANPPQGVVFTATLIAGILGARRRRHRLRRRRPQRHRHPTPRPRPRLHLLGLFGGAFGGCVGQLLNNHLGVPIVVGWMLAGVLIGAGIGAFDVIRAVKAGESPKSGMKKSLNGVYGGLIGGLLGGLPFTLLVDSPALPRSGQLIGLVLLGASIGLMIGLAQVFLKEAWVKVEEGFRPGRELMLTKEETTIGRAETCDLGLFADNSIEKLHASIIQKNNRYLLAHVGEGGETLLNDQPVGEKPEPLHAGDEIRIGRSLLSFGERQKKKRR